MDGNELVQRKGHGQLAMFIQIQDSSDRVYQTHGAVELDEVKDAAAKSNIIYAQDAFVLPGDYRVSMALLDVKTGEHGAMQRALHVNPLKNDPLPGAWADLPTVELLPLTETPDDIFLPSVSGHMRLPIETRSPIQLDVLMNVSRSELDERDRANQASKRSLPELLPALKVLSHVDVKGGSTSVSLLDLTRQRTSFFQTGARELDWGRMRVSLAEADPNRIDVVSLAKRQKNAQFFVDQVRQRIDGGRKSPGGPLHVTVVLSGPIEFDSGEDKRPIQLEGKQEGKVFYIRYHTLPPPPSLASFYEGPGLRPRNVTIRVTEPLDALVPMLKSIDVRLFDVYNPEQFRKALAQMLAEIAKL